METLNYPKETKSNKIHKCDLCNYRIPKGDIYMKSTHKYEGEVYSWKTHKHCAHIADRLKMYENCDEGLTQDDFMQTIHYEHDDILMLMIPDNKAQRFRDIIQQLQRVNFNDKLGYVIRHYKELDKLKTKQDDTKQSKSN